MLYDYALPHEILVTELQHRRASNITSGNYWSCQQQGCYYASRSRLSCRAAGYTACQAGLPEPAQD